MTEKRVSVALSGAILLTAVPVLSNAFQNDRDAMRADADDSHILELVATDKAHLYLYGGAGDGISWSYYDIWSVPESGSQSNLYPLGGWRTEAPILNNINAQYSVSNPFADCVDNPSVYMLTQAKWNGWYINRRVEYIREHFESCAYAVCVKVVDNTYSVYRIVASTPSDSLKENAIDASKYIDCGLNVSEEDDLITISDSLTCSEPVSFSENIYVGLEDLSGQEYLYYTTQTDINGDFSNFSMSSADCAYGPEGQSDCLFNEALAAKRCKVAALSTRLLRRLFKKKEDKMLSIETFLNEAAGAAERARHIPEVMFSICREIQIEDLFITSKKRALIVSHEFSMTGAPIVLVNAIPALISMDFEVVVLGPEYGPAAKLFLDAGAVTVSCRKKLEHTALRGIAMNCDLVLLNTVVERDAVKCLSGEPVPVVWWLHDAFQGYSFIANSLPRKLESNVHVCAVGSHATAAMHSVRSDFQIDQLIYGLPDYAEDSFEQYSLDDIGKKQLFVTVGSLEYRKGQDVLCDAIRMIPEEKRNRSAFLFVGKVNDEKIFNSVQALVKEDPAHVFYRESLTRSEIKSMMQQCDCIICSSRDDPMPTFVTEGLIFGKPAIVSEHTGTAGLIHESVDGFVYQDDDPEKLKDCIEYLIDHPELTRKMSSACRTLYEQNFTYQSFRASLEKIVTKALRGDQ